MFKFFNKKKDNSDDNEEIKVIDSVNDEEEVARSEACEQEADTSEKSAEDSDSQTEEQGKSLLSNLEIGIPLSKEHIQMLCNTYIAEAMSFNKIYEGQDIEMLCCTELAVLIQNSEMILGTALKDNEEKAEIVRKNRKVFRDALLDAVRCGPLYVLSVEATHLPYAPDAPIFFGYTDKEKAEKLASQLTEINQKHIAFYVQEVQPTDFENFFSRVWVSGFEGCSVDGAKLAVPTVEFFDNTKSFGKINRNLPQRMVALMQHSFLSPRDKYFNATGERLLFACIDEMQRSNLFLPVRGIENLEDGSPVKAGSKVSIPFIVKKDGSKWIPIFTDGLAVADAFHQNQQVIMDNFPSHCNVVTEQYSGFIINPGRGQMDFPKQWIVAAQNYWKKKNLCTQEVDVDGRKLRFGDLEQSSNTDEVTELLSNAMTKIKGARSAYLRYMWQPFAISYVLVIDTTEDELIIPEELRQINFSKFGVAFLDSVKFKSDISYITEGKEPFWKA